MTTEARYERWKRLGTEVWTLVGIAVLLAAALWLVGRTWRAVVPFLLALAVVFLLRSPVRYLERRGLPRVWSVVVVYVAAGILATVAVGFILPPLVDQISQFITAFPGYYDRVSGAVLDLGDRYRALRLPVWWTDFESNVRTGIVARLTALSTALAGGLLTVGSGAVSLLFDFILALVIAFYLLLDYDKIRAELLTLFGTRNRGEAELVMNTVSTVVGGFLRGQFLIAMAVGVISAIGLMVLRVPYGLAIGLIIGFIDVVPYLGPIVGAVLVGISAAFVSWPLALIAVLFVVAVQQIEGLFLAPRIMSEQVDLHPVLVIFSLLMGAALAGLPGMLLAIPVAATAKGLFVYYFEKHTREELASEEGALFRGTTPEPPKDPGRKPSTGGR
jgi:predicted PurR-regulated permease PerM